MKEQRFFMLILLWVLLWCQYIIGTIISSVYNVASRIKHSIFYFIIHYKIFVATGNIKINILRIIINKYY